MFLTLKRTSAALLLGVVLVSFAYALPISSTAQQWLFKQGQDARAEQWQGKSVWLDDYQVQIQAQPIKGVEDDLSALTYDHHRNTLFSVTNGSRLLLELSLEGELLREIELTGFLDPEAVEYIEPGVLVIADERLQQLVRIEIDDETRSVDLEQSERLTLNFDLREKNKGFEGLAYDASTRRLFVGKEQNPLRILEVKGFPPSKGLEPLAVDVQENTLRDDGLFVTDISSLHYVDQYHHLLVLSDESRLLVELDAEGEAISSLSLEEGKHGLRNDVPQAEGVTMGPDGTIYITSEPNLFYTFTKPGHAR
ncbi:SdiA-regulated domain-containing protein [Stutzerimonas zhaodongensis]|uniref:SdiA-regulated domain-containing protein n=1 Tax=Stutzerimonas zhaodongensis TaxID=1176257 RepID=UPI0039EEBA04